MASDPAQWLIQKTPSSFWVTFSAPSIPQISPLIPHVLWRGFEWVVQIFKKPSRQIHLSINVYFVIFQDVFREKVKLCKGKEQLYIKII